MTRQDARTLIDVGLKTCLNREELTAEFAAPDEVTPEAR